MPREKQKRGRRAEAKNGKNAAKRIRENGTDERAAKRQRPLAETEDFITLDDQENAPLTGMSDGPFYGLLDSEEQEYFSRANELLELNQFPDAEERRLFLESVYEEAKGKELKIACSQSCSRLMEKLISMSDIQQIRRLFNTFIGHFLHLVQHRFASHCCETLFIHAAPGVSENFSKKDKKKSKDELEIANPELSLADMFLKVVEELEGNWGYLLTDRFASHTIRLLLLVLAGEPIDMSSMSIIASRKKERFGSMYTEPPTETEISRKRNVPDSFTFALKKAMTDMTSALDDTYLRALSTHPVGNPVLQVLLSLELGHFGKSTAKDPKSITRRLIPEESLEEGSQSTVFLRGLLYDPVGSRLLEALLRCAPGKLFRNIHKNIIGDRIGSLSRNEIASYIVVRVLERIGKDDLQSDMNLILPEIPNLIDRSRFILPRVLIERCVARNVNMGPLIAILESAYDKDPAVRLEQLLKMQKPPSAESEQYPEPKAKSSKKNIVTPEKIHGSLLAQTMLRVPGPLSDLIYSSLLATPSETLLNIARDATASHVLQQALTLPTSSTPFRRQFTPHFFGHIKELSLDSSGSHVVDSLCLATRDIFFVKERFAQELAQNELVLRDSFYGRAVWKNWLMDLYKRRRGEWTQKAKGLDDRQTEGSNTNRKYKSQIQHRHR
jgi:nucleolar protein 9